MPIDGGFVATSNGSSPACEDAERDPDATAEPRLRCGVTVVVCAYTERRWDQTVRAVSSVLGQQVPADQVILVVDHNAALLDRARAALRQVDVVASTGPRGLSGARNTGVAYARGEIVAFLDDDAEAEPDWLARLLAHYRDPAVLAVGGRAVPAWESTRPRWLPPEFDWVVGCSFTGQPSSLAEVRNLIGANMSFRRAALDRIGGFDPALGRVGRVPIGCEETELCIRMRQAHPRGVVLYEPAARVHHQVSEDRTTWRYFRRRCISEGRSKAVVARLVGSGAGLSAEREYTRRALPEGVRQGLRQAFQGDSGGLVRAAAITAGLLMTAAGYASAYVSGASRAATASDGREVTSEAGDASATAGPGPRRRRDMPAPVRVLTVELSEGVPELSDAGGPNGARYGAAQVLVRLHGHPLGLVEIELPAGGLTAREHAEAMRLRLGSAIDAHLLRDGQPPFAQATVTPITASCTSRPITARDEPFVSVVVPTCGRVLLERSLDSLARLEYPHFEVVVVDNAPHLPATAELVMRRAATDARIRYCSEPRAGVTHARNRGLAEARGEIAAFADDDVIVDPHWLRALVNGFTDTHVAAVTGQVLAGELDSPAQVWIERYGGFGKGYQRQRFERNGFETAGDGGVQRVPAESKSLYPYLPGSYGTGANMAFRTSVARALGGFDDLLGSGGAVGAGEDIDLLMRVVLGGHALVYEPAAIVWHTHPREVGAVRRTVYRYGVGLSAVMAKCLVSAADRREVLRRVPRGIAYALAPQSEKNVRKRAGYPASLTALELCGLVLGPAHYAAAALSAGARRLTGPASRKTPGGSDE